MGRGALASWKYCKVLFVLQMLSKVTSDEVFMHYFEKMWPWTPLGTSVLHTPSLPTLGKTAGVHANCSVVV